MIVDGRLIENLHAEDVRRVVALADAIEALARANFGGGGSDSDLRSQGFCQPADAARRARLTPAVAPGAAGRWQA